MAAVNQRRQLDSRRPAVVEDLVDRGTHGAAGVEDVVDDHDRLVVDAEVELGGVDDGRARPDAEVIAVEGDVDEAERHRLLEQLTGQSVQPPGEMGAAAVDADQRHRTVRVLLDNLVCDPHQRAANVIAVEDDRRGFQRAPSWPRGTGLKGPTCAA